MHPLAILTVLAMLRISTSVAEDAPHSKVDRQLMKQSLFYGLVATAAEEPLKNTCMKQLAETADGVLARSRWAIKMLDASGVPSAKLYFGGTYWLGDRGICEETLHPKHNPSCNKTGLVYKETVKDIPPFPLAFFVAYFQHRSKIQIVTNLQEDYRITWSMCLPESCEGLELNGLLKKYFDQNIFVHQFIYNTTYEMEEVKKLEDDYSWLSDTKVSAMGTVTALLIFLCIIGTIYDVNYYQPMLKSLKNLVNIKNNNGEKVNLCKKIKMNRCDKDYENQVFYQNDEISEESINENLGLKMLRCFSVHANHKSIVSVKPNSDALMSIHGIRLIFTIYALVAHTGLFMKDFFSNRPKAIYLSDELRYQIFIQAIFSIDSFFCISGLIFAYGFFTTLYQDNPKKKYGLSERMYLFALGVVRRFLRIMPSYAYTLFVAEILAVWRFRVSPFWANERIDLICPNYWWRNFLFINNLYPRSEMCLAWSWYLSVDMQFFLVFNFVLVLSTVYFKAAANLLGALFFGSIAYTANLVYRTNFIPYMDEIYLSREDFYDNPITRVGPFIVGIIGGYILYYYKRTLPIKRHYKWLCWIISCTISISILFGVTDRNFTLPGSAAYVSLSRSLWGLSVCWLIIACETGNAGIINKILSAEVWRPFSRLSFMVYLLNPIIIFFFASFTNIQFELEFTNFVLFCCGFLLITYFMSYLITLMIEFPNIRLTKMLFDYLKKREKSAKVLHEVNSNVHKRISEESEDFKIPDGLKSR